MEKHQGSELRGEKGHGPRSDHRNMIATGLHDICIHITHWIELKGLT